MAGKAEIADAIANETHLTPGDALVALNALTSIISDRLVRGEDTQLTGFGKFSTTQRNARTGRNPATGALINIPPSRGIRFKPSKGLKELVNG